MTEIPNWEREDEENLSWKNTETGTVIGVIYDEYYKDGKWIVTGQNSVVEEAETEGDAKERAIEWMLEHPRPSAMV